jgi:hypothetical protein
MNSDSKMDIDIIEEMVFQEVEDILLKEVAQDPGYELKLFVTPVRCSISKTLGGDKTDTFNEITRYRKCHYSF